MTGIAVSAAPARTIAAPMPLAPPVTSTTLFSSSRSTVLSQSAVQIHDTAIQRVIHSGNERSRVRAQEEGKRGDLVRFPHSANWLRLRQFLEHLLLAAGMVLFQITIDECRMHPGRGNTVTANVCGRYSHAQRNRSSRSPRLCWSSMRSAQPVRQIRPQKPCLE